MPKMKCFNHFTNKRFFATEFQKSIQVSVLGAHTPLGRNTSFLLKQNPIISVLKLQGEYLISNLVADLEGIDTKCRVVGYEGTDGISKALTSVDVVLMLGIVEEDTLLVDRVLSEGRRVYDLTKKCIEYAPRSLIVVNVPPVSVMTPLVAAVYKQSYWYHPGRIIGSAALAQIKANCVFGRYQGLDPHICKVPITGGPDCDLAVPLLSRAKPIELSDRIAKSIAAKFRNVDLNKFPRVSGNEDYLEKCMNSEAFALNNLLSCIAAGFCGDKEAYYNAFIRTKAVDTCQHLVTTLQFSRGGVVHNFGVPQLTDLELELFEKATLAIKKREQMAGELLEYIETGGTQLPPFKIQDMERRKMLQESVIS